MQRASSPPGTTRPTSRTTGARYAAKRRVFLDLFERRGIEVAGSEATFYLWVKVPGGETLAGVGRRAAGSRRCDRGARLVLRAGGRGVRADRDGADARGLPAGGRRARRCCWPTGAGMNRDDLAARIEASVRGSRRRARRRGGRGRDRAARPRRAARRRARRRRLAGERVGEEGGPALLPRARARDDRRRAVRVPRQASAEVRVRGARASASCRRRPPGTARSCPGASC